MPEEEVISYLEPIEEDDTAFERAISEEKRREQKLEQEALKEVHTETKSEQDKSHDALYQKMLSSAPEATVSNDDVLVDADAQSVSAKIDADSRVNQLVDLALTKGVPHAVRVAKKLGDFYVLDQMHDDLANRLYDSLKEKGLIEV